MLVKVRQRLFCVRKLAGFGLEFEKQLWLFQVMVFSVIIYCAPVWLSSCSKTQLALINKYLEKYTPITSDYIDHVSSQYASNIVCDLKHPLNSFHSKPRRLYTLPRMRTESFKISFFT